jgi:cytochrome c oxidase subunit III
MATAVNATDGPELASHFDDPQQQHDSALLGMWAFLATELLFFGGLFLAYTVYRGQHFAAFAAASRKLSVALGGINTAVLLTSSLTMALAVRAAQLRKKRQVVLLMVVTMILGALFLGIKSYEYYDDYEHSLIPGAGFLFAEPFKADAEMFFLIYFLMTGLHALHLIIGITLVGIITILCAREGPIGRRENQMEVVGLYWHFVDLMWVFLYPMLYLIEVHK